MALRSTLEVFIQLICAKHFMCHELCLGQGIQNGEPKGQLLSLRDSML